MENFTPVSALLGGALIGLGIAALILLNGRIAGISGVVGGLLRPQERTEFPWRLAFVIGLVAAPLLLLGTAGSLVPEIRVDAAYPLVIAGGLLVGFGTRLGSGCTSGHGVAGVGRLSPRSLAATGVFMALGFAAATVLSIIIGG